jgi:diguanylate cyclase (GGDEF)-like protein/PAS domain S-box-containing protein
MNFGELRLLLAEDDEGAASLVTSEIAETTLGATVSVNVARTAPETLSKLSAGTYDVVILSGELAGSSGLTGLREVRAAHPAVPVILLADGGDDAAGAEAIKAGACEYLSRARLKADVLGLALRSAVATGRQEAAERQAAEELRREEDRYRDLVERSGVLVGEHDLEGRILSVNDAAASAWGYPAEELVGRTIDSLLDPRHRSEFGGYLEAIRRDGTARGLMSVRTRSGSTRIWDYRNTLSRDRAGTPVVRALSLDVTERQLAERKLAQLASIVESSDDAIIGLTLEGRVLSWNRGAERLYGYEAREMLDGDLSVLLPPGHASEISSLLARIRRGERVAQVFTERVHKDGRRIPVALTLSPIRSSRGALVGASAIARDMTEAKLADESLRASEERYRTLFERNLAGVFRSTTTGVMLECNEAFAKVYGYPSPREVLETPVEELHFAGEDRARLIETLARDGKITNVECRTHRLGGEPVWVLVNMQLTAPRPGEPGIIEGTVLDITERKLSEEALRTSELQYRQLFETANDAILIFEPETEMILEANRKACEMYGVPRDELIGTSLKSFAREVARGEDLVRQLLRDGSYTNFETVHFRRDGQLLDLLVSASVVTYGGRPAILSIHRDVTETKGAERRIEQLASTDALTGLPNRTRFVDRLELAIAHGRSEEHSVAILYVDLDRFRLVIDSLGHKIGDFLLQRVAERLGQLMRGVDTLARPGGDEFLIALARISSPDDAAKVAEKIHDLFQKPFNLAGRELYITASIGVSIFPGDGDDAETLMMRADAALHRAKGQGRDTYRRHTSSIAGGALDRLSLEMDLRKALDGNHLTVHYQPLVAIPGLEIVGMEALARWTHPETGPIPPAEFIPLAEETGLINALGDFVLREAATQTRGWHRSGFPDLRLAVNLSARQFRQPDPVARVLEILSDVGLDPRFLDIEITETMAMENVENTVRVLTELKRHGIRVTMDDFGTGYSSLSYLKKFPIDTVKIDQSFVRDLTTDPNDAAIARATLVMAHELRLRVVAEGVETAEQLDFLRIHRCDEMQGYYFSRPLAAEGFGSLLVRRREERAAGTGAW